MSKQNNSKLDQLEIIEQLERKYLNKYFHFLKSVEDELLEGFKTKERIKDDWFGLYKSGISDFAVGAERIVYSLMNGRSIGVPNSCPVGADLFFEVQDAFIHIDLKTVGASLTGKTNIGDYTSNIFVGTNQNSYKSEIKRANGNYFDPVRYYTPTLPSIYNKGKSSEKICLSYFITILYDKDTLDTLVISIVCMPNGELESHYKHRVLQAGKVAEETRFKFTDVSDFELLDRNTKRVKVVYFDENMHESYKKKLKFFEDLHKDQ
jgi:hypothetical protein